MNKDKNKKAMWDFIGMLIAFHRNEIGALNATGLLMMGIGMIFLAIGFIVYPIIITGTDAILAYAYSGNASITDATYTGLTAVTGITPLLVLIGFVTSGVVVGFLGMRMQRAGVSARLDPINLLLLAIGVIFIAVGLIIFPVVLDGVSSVVHGGGSGISATYVGLEAVILVTPLLVLIAFVSAAVISGFFGVRGISKSL